MNPRTPRPLEVLLADPATVHAAVGALGMAGADPRWCPYAAVVSAKTVTVHVVCAAGVAGVPVPIPGAPWRISQPPDIWDVDRDAVRRPEDYFVRPVVVGSRDDAVVVLDAARAPGPITVSGEPAAAAGLRSLLTAQLPPRCLADSDPGWDHWPILVAHGAVRLLGAEIARTLSARDSRLAAEAVLRAAHEGQSGEE